MAAGTRNQHSTFQPRSFLKNRHVQSVLASSHLIVPPHRLLLKDSREFIIETPGGSRLLSYLAPHPRPRGMMILLHGWEGSSSSAYILAAGSYFFDRNFSVCRLNLRDHGDSHHLNPGLFHGALIEETFDAVNAISRKAENRPVYLLGFSLGANFALRIAMRHSMTPIENLKKVFAVSPPLDPYKTTLTIDNGPALYRNYFLRKWKRSLRKKQGAFPNRYDFGGMLRARSCMELTDQMMAYFPEFSSYRAYFQLYTLTENSFRDLGVPVKIFIAADDPVICLDDFRKLRDHGFLTISRQPFGGHCGFVDLFPHRRWYNERIFEELHQESNV
ncbi:MAG TPA: alpha/beta fold hydrolase [Smithellaceae bacterium]|nr:alpha/beta fold hydrolase [Smithellaceae bacterium]HRS82303.1 alpha/beta fold hydrolase [Smithellaceae bacterium]